MENLSTPQLMEQLMKKPHEEVELVILQLMLNKDEKNRLSSHTILDLYMKSLEIQNEDKWNQLVESNTSILELLLNVRTENKGNTKAIHRALYNLNSAGVFNMKSLNDKYRYDEEKDKELSWYYRNSNDL